jgi:hypothetical protein
MDAQAALAFVRDHGVVLASARGPVPTLTHAIAGEAIRGSWWGHPQGKQHLRGAAGGEQRPRYPRVPAGRQEDHAGPPAPVAGAGGGRAAAFDAARLARVQAGTQRARPP